MNKKKGKEENNYRFLNIYTFNINDINVTHI